MSETFQFKKEVKKDELLKNHCSFGIGGKADYFYETTTIEDLKEVVGEARDAGLSVFILAGGTNILFGDKGFRGLVVKNKINSFELGEDSIRVSSGVMMPVLVHKSVEADLSGLEKFTGLPGTVGGAIFGNAGCNGIEIKDVLKEAEILNVETGEVKTVAPDYFNFEYRKSVLRETREVVLTATFSVKKGVDMVEFNELKDKLSTYRREKQPSGKTNGSFFKNPSKEMPAGMLIDRVGLKGKTIGGAQISEMHANFFMNINDAKAVDILALSDLATKKVLEEFDIELQQEVQLVGEF